jgi:hypothetical protein
VGCTSLWSRPTATLTILPATLLSSVPPTSTSMLQTTVTIADTELEPRPVRTPLRPRQMLEESGVCPVAAPV